MMNDIERQFLLNVLKSHRVVDSDASIPDVNKRLREQMPSENWNINATIDEIALSDLEQEGHNRATADKGDTLLHFAVNNGLSEAVDILLENGAEPAVKNTAGETALHCAAHPRIYTNYPDPQGAIRHGDIDATTPCDIIEKLLRISPDLLKEVDNNGYIPLTTALGNQCEQGRGGEEIIETLLTPTVARHDKKHLINLKNNNGFTPLCIALGAGYSKDIINTMISAGANKKGAIGPETPESSTGVTYKQAKKLGEDFLRNNLDIATARNRPSWVSRHSSQKNNSRENYLS